jgi:hypothetical protein
MKIEHGERKPKIQHKITYQMTSVHLCFEFGMFLLQRAEKFEIFGVFFGIRCVHRQKWHVKMPEITLTREKEKKIRESEEPKRTRRAKRKRTQKYINAQKKF